MKFISKATIAKLLVVCLIVSMMGVPVAAADVTGNDEKFGDATYKVEQDAKGNDVYVFDEDTDITGSIEGDLNIKTEDGKDATVGGGAEISDGADVTIESGNDANIGGGSENDGAKITGGKVTVTAKNDATIGKGAEISGNAEVTITAKKDATVGDGAKISGGTVTITAEEGTATIDNGATISGNADVKITAPKAVVKDGAKVSGGKVEITAKEDATIGKMEVSGGGDVTVKATTSVTATGTEISAGKLGIEVDSGKPVAMNGVTLKETGATLAVKAGNKDLYTVTGQATVGLGVNVTRTLLRAVVAYADTATTDLITGDITLNAAGAEFKYLTANGAGATVKYADGLKESKTTSGDYTIVKAVAGGDVTLKLNVEGSTYGKVTKVESAGLVDNGDNTYTVKADTAITITVSPTSNGRVDSVNYVYTTGSDTTTKNTVKVGKNSTYTFSIDKDAVVTVKFARKSTGGSPSGGGSSGGSGSGKPTTPGDTTTPPGSTTTTSPFKDVSTSAYYYDAVLWAIEKGITVGMTADTFGPDVSCTRAQMLTMLWRLAGSPKAEGENPFTDVSASDYYYDAVMWAVAKGITAGTTANTFSPDATVNRAQSVTFLYRYAGQPAVSGSSFNDIGAGDYYANAAAWASKNGIALGYGDGNFGPNDDCVRAQIVTFMYRYAG